MIDKTDPTNRDTVPAMLTPGEFVLNKEATEMYGPVIQQMNSAGLQQRAAENKAMEVNMGGGIPPKGYNIGGNVQGLKGLLNFIGSGEGGYDSSNRGTVGGKIIGSTNKTVSNGKKLSEMTIDEIIAAQNMQGDDKLFAVGKYQMIPSTFKEVMEGLGVSGDTVFSPDFQDTAGMYLITQKRPKLGEYLNGGDVDEDFALEELAKEFASAPLPYDVMVGDTLRKAGESRYGSGNKAQHSIQEARDALRSAKITMTGEYPSDPKSYGEYSPEMFLQEANKFNTPGSAMVMPTEPPKIQMPPSNQTSAIPEMRESPPVFADPSTVPNNNNVPAVSFGQAFNQARQELGSGKTFEYDGKKFSTNFAEEEKVMTANMGGKACSCGKKKVCDCGSDMMYANMGGNIPMLYANNGSQIPDDGLRLPEINSDESLLQGSSQSVDEARFKKQIEMQKFMEYQQQQRGIPNNQIPMDYNLETRKTGNPGYRQEASDNILFSGANVGYGEMSEEQDLNNSDAYFDNLSTVPAMNVPITPPNIPTPRLDDGLRNSPPPTFMGDVVPYSKRVGRSLLNTVKNDLSNYTDNLPESIKDSKRMMEINKIPEPKAASIDTDQLIQDAQTKFLTAEAESNINYLKNKQSNSTDVNEIISLDAQIKDQTDALQVTQKNMEANEIDKIRRKNMSPIVSQIQESADRANVSFDQLATKHIANVEKEKAEIQAILSRTDLNLSPEATTALTKKVTSLDALVAEITGSSTPPPAKVSPSNKLSNKQMVQSLTTQLQQLDDVQGSNKSDPDPDNLPKPDPKEIPEAKSALKDFFGDIFDTKELARAAIMYLGGRATGMSGNQALAFAGKQYINRSDAKENTYQKLAMSGKYSKASLALYRKTRDPNSLILKSVPLVNMGSPKEFYDTITNKRFISQKMKDPVTGNMMYVKEDGVTPVDFTRTTEDPRYVPTTKENDQMRVEQTKRLSEMVTEFNNLENNQTDGKTKNERRAYLQIAPNVIGKSAVNFMIKNQISESAMGEILNNVMTEAVNDLKSGDIKNLNSLDSYFRKSYIQVETNDSVNFELKDGSPVSPSSVKSFLNAIRQIGQDNQIKDLNDTNLSSWLMEQSDYKIWKSMSQSDKQFYINEGMNNKKNDRQSGMMVFILDKLAP